MASIAGWLAAGGFGPLEVPKQIKGVKILSSKLDWRVGNSQQVSREIWTALPFGWAQNVQER